MTKILKSFFYSLLLINIYFLVSCCSTKAPDTNSQQPGTDTADTTNKEITAFVVLDKESDISSTWTNEFLMPTLPGAFLANDFTFKKGAAQLASSTAQYGQRVVEKTMLEERDAYTIYKLVMQVAAVKSEPNLTTAYRHIETIRTSFNLADLVKKGKVLYQPTRYALLKAIESKAVARGQVGLSSLEYLNDGRFQAEVIIRY